MCEWDSSCVSNTFDLTWLSLLKIQNTNRQNMCFDMLSSITGLDLCLCPVFIMMCRDKYYDWLFSGRRQWEREEESEQELSLSLSQSSIETIWLFDLYLWAFIAIYVFCLNWIFIFHFDPTNPERRSSIAVSLSFYPGFINIFKM